MKALNLGLAFFLTAGIVFANEDYAKQAFLNDENVKAALTLAKRRYTVDSEPKAIFVKESCGFAGCISRYLVSIGLRASGINPQSASILARVEVLNSGTKTIVEILSDIQKKCLDLQHIME